MSLGRRGNQYFSGVVVKRLEGASSWVLTFYVNVVVRRVGVTVYTGVKNWYLVFIKLSMYARVRYKTLSPLGILLKRGTSGARW